MLFDWLTIIRPKTLSASLAPLLVGQVLALQLSPQFSWVLALMIFSCGLLLQISVNLANDYFDDRAGIDTDDRLGPRRAIQQGALSAIQVKKAMQLILCGAIGCGLYLVWYGGVEYLLLGSVCVLGVLGYSGGRMPLASNALGELAVFVFFGPIAVLGSFYLQVADTHVSEPEQWRVLLYALQMGLWASAIMLVNNIRDIASDTQVNKMTLPVLLKPRLSKLLYAGVLSIVLILAYVNQQSPWLLVFGLLATAYLSGTMFRLPAQRLNALLAKTAAGTLLWGILCAIDMSI